MEAAVGILYQASQLMLVVATGLILYRLSLGPTIFDRVVGFETIGLAVVGYLLLESNATAGRLYTDAALGLALFSVVGTVFLGYFLGRGEFPDE
jgi:multisubunit Na+/H+ antiporter MnhF subunit